MLVIVWTLVASAAEPVTPVSAPESYEIAITIDDLPWAGAVPPDGRKAATLRLLDQLDKAGVKATGFVNCGKPDQELLDLWVRRGHTLGNHTTEHLDIDKVPLEDWLTDARTCRASLSERLGAPPVFFRYPYLRNGKVEASRDRAHAVLTGELGHTVGRVSVDNHDWKLGFLYGDALVAGDAVRAAAIADYYPGHLRDAVHNYRDVARRKLGRDVKHVLLLHANALAADHLADALEVLRQDGARFISLEEALADPVYAMPDAYLGGGGLSWLYHVRPDDQRYVWDDKAWRDLVSRFEKE